LSGSACNLNSEVFLGSSVAAVLRFGQLRKSADYAQNFSDLKVGLIASAYCFEVCLGSALRVFSCNRCPTCTTSRTQHTNLALFLAFLWLDDPQSFQFEAR
jgi:hypothetical protein